MLTSPVEDDRGFLGARDRSLEPVGVAFGMGTVPGGLAFLAARIQDFKDVEFAAARVPAQAVAVLFRSRNLGVEHPGCRRVCIEAGRPRQWHAKLEQEQLRRPVEAIF